MASNLIRINNRDNVAVAIKPLMKGDVVTVDGNTFTVFSDIPAGHKVALSDIKKQAPPSAHTPTRGGERKWAR